MSQRSIEMVIGRLSTDEAFRAEFVGDPRSAIEQLLERGMHLTSVEVAALIATDAALWEHIADRIDPRLQKAGAST